MIISRKATKLSKWVQKGHITRPIFQRLLTPNKQCLSGNLRRLHCWRALAKVIKMVATEIKTPVSNIYQKYVHTCFMVKMRIDVGSFGLFWVLLVQFGNVPGRIFRSFIFGVLWVKKFKFGSTKIWGMDVETVLYLRMYKYLVKEVWWWNMVYCVGVWEVAFNFWKVLYGF